MPAKKNRGFKFNEKRQYFPKVHEKLFHHKKYREFLYEQEEIEKCEKSLKVRKMTKEEMEKYLVKKAH